MRPIQRQYGRGVLLANAIAASLALTLSACGDPTREPRAAAADSTDAAPAAAVDTIVRTYLTARELIGQPDAGTLRGVESLGFAIIQVDGASRYAFDHVRIREGRALILNRFTYDDEVGRPHWIATDVVLLPALPDSADLIVALCRAAGKPDKRLAAIVHRTKHPWLSATAGAWKANLRTERIETVPVSGIECENAGL